MIILTVLMTGLWIWLFYEIKNAPIVDENENTIP